MTKEFSIVILGGPRLDPQAAMLAAAVLGYSETLVGYLVSSSLTELVSLVAILLASDSSDPPGLFGKHVAF